MAAVGGPWDSVVPESQSSEMDADVPDEQVLDTDVVPTAPSGSHLVDQPTQADGPELPVAPRAVGDALVWSVTEDAQPVGGASFDLWGPYARSGGWGSSITVQDCTQAPCTSTDLDPAPGLFRVEAGRRGAAIDSASRYRIQARVAPKGFQFSDSQQTREIVGTSDTSATPAPGQWVDGIYDFDAFSVRVETYSPTCAAGYFYSINGNGQMLEIGPDGQPVNLGQRVSGSGLAMNGLGIGLQGEAVYAINRIGGSNYDKSAEVYRFDTETGEWSSTGVRYNNTGTNLVAGAVRLHDGRFFFGGFNSGGTEFRIFMYDEANSQVVDKGTIDVSASNVDAANGDIAFDLAGNLYIIQSGSSTVVYSVTADDLLGSWGGDIPSSVTQPARGVLGQVNGAALDSDGGLALGNASQISLYDMPSINNGVQVTRALSDSTDLASCDSPRTVTIEKELPYGRVNDSDQFRLQLLEGETVISQATTQGTAPGVQVQRLGPLPVSTNRTLHFSEVFTNGDASQYQSSWYCKLDGVLTSQGTGTDGSWDIESEGQDVVCRFVNVPRVAYVNVTKIVQDAAGHEITTPEIKAGWEFNLGAAGGQIDQDTKTTGDSGTLQWKVEFSPDESQFPVRLRETQQQGYRLAEGSQCTKTGVTGTESDPFPAENPVDLTVGDRVDCTFINRQLGTLTVNKEVRNTYGGPAPSQDYFDLTATHAAGAVLEYPEPNVAQPAEVGDYLIEEADRPGYRQTGITCQKDGGEEFELVDGNLEVEPTDGAVVCTVHNEDLPGSVSWVKTGPDGEQLLAGSEWTLRHPLGGESQVVTDCVADTAEECVGADLDPAAGKFLVGELRWGDYELSESAAPAGYQINPDNVGMTVTVAPENLDVTVETAPNYPRSGPDLPLTGGSSADLYLLGGGLVAALGLTSWAWLNRRKLGAGR